MLVCDVEEENSDLSIAKILLLFRIGVAGSNESEQEEFLLYLSLTRSMDAVHETLECVCLM